LNLPYGKQHQIFLINKSLLLCLFFVNQCDLFIFLKSISISVKKERKQAGHSVLHHKVQGLVSLQTYPSICECCISMEGYCSIQSICVESCVTKETNERDLGRILGVLLHVIVDPNLPKLIINEFEKLAYKSSKTVTFEHLYQVTEESPADRAEIQPNDVIIKCDREVVSCSLKVRDFSCLGVERPASLVVFLSFNVCPRKGETRVS
jgi:hypothetical protein